MKRSVVRGIAATEGIDPVGMASAFTSHQLRVTSHGCCSSLSCYFIASLLPHLTQEALPVGNRALKILRDCLPHIRQRVPNSQVYACSASRRIRQNRHV